MKLIFELGVEGRGMTLMPECDVPEYQLPEERTAPLHLPHVSENELTRHYTALCKRIHGVNDGFYPLGSCTMKYNPKIDEDMAALPGFTQLHPLQSVETAQGALEVLHTLGGELGEVFGMDAVTFQPAAGAHGEFTGVLLIKAYHTDRGDTARTKIIVPDSAHGTNPATAAMCGFQVVNIPSGEDGCVDLDALRAAVGPDTAGLMLTNPNTVGIFDKNILEITKIVHDAGGLCYYDGANLNAVMGVVRPGDMGFDCIHSNLHKTFATPFDFADLTLRMDSLSAFMVLVISLLVVVCSLYSLTYMREYEGKGAAAMGFFMNLFIASMVALLVMDNAFWFIVLFEMMSLSSWFLVIARQDKTSINAGMLYFFIAHAGSVLIMIAFLLMGRESGSLDFASFARFHFLRGWRRRCFCWPFSVLARKPG